MSQRILFQRASHLLASGLSVTAQRLPFLNHLAPLLTSPATLRVATPIVVSFAGTDTLSGQSVRVSTTGGSVNPATGKVGEEFVWLFRTIGETPHSYSVSTLPPGLTYTFGSSISSITGTPTTAGEYSIDIVAWEETRQRGDHTPTYTLSLTVTQPASPLEIWTMSFWSGTDLDDPAISGPNGDPDQDGIDNLLEFALNLDPTKPEAFPGTFATDPADSNFLIYTLPFNPDAEGLLKFQQSTSLKAGEWTDIDPENPDTEVTKTADAIILRLPKAVADRKLIRVVATL